MLKIKFFYKNNLFIINFTKEEQDRDCYFRYYILSL